MSSRFPPDETKSYRPSRLQSGRRTPTEVARRRWSAQDYRPDLQVAVILPGLLLGSQEVAKDLSRLRQLGVSHILNLATGVPNCFPAEITYKRLNIRDQADTDIRRHFDECHKFIDEGRRRGWVLVHCNAGVSRAATICISYVMSRQQVHLQDAIRKVKEARPIICPNEGFAWQLREFEKDLFGIVLLLRMRSSIETAQKLLSVSIDGDPKGNIDLGEVFLGTLSAGAFARERPQECQIRICLGLPTRSYGVWWKDRCYMGKITDVTREHSAVPWWAFFFDRHEDYWNGLA